MSEVESNLKRLGYDLPPAPRPMASYVPWVRTGNLVYIAGQGPIVNGEVKFRGYLGKEFTLEQGQQAARIAALNLLAVAKDAVGDLDRIRKIVKVVGFVRSAPGFTDQPVVINGASDLLVLAFGEKGTHARSAVGANELPMGIAVEIEAVLEVE